MNTSVVKFMNDYGVRISPRRVEDYRLLPFPVTHSFIEVGKVAEGQGITNGVDAYIRSQIDGEVYHVHWSNCKQAGTGQRGSKQNYETKEKKPRKEKPFEEMSLKQQTKKLREDKLAELLK